MSQCLGENYKKAAEGNGISIQRSQSKASVTPEEKKSSSQWLKRSSHGLWMVGWKWDSEMNHQGDDAGTLVWRCWNFSFVQLNMERWYSTFPPSWWYGADVRWSDLNMKPQYLKMNSSYLTVLKFWVLLCQGSCWNYQCLFNKPKKNLTQTKTALRDPSKDRM